MVNEAYVNWLLSSAHSYLGQNMAPQAITLLELLNELQPNNQQTLRMLAYGYLLDARYQQVIETATMLEGLNKQDEEQRAFLMLVCSRALWGLGKGEESKTEFEKYVRLLSTLKPSLQE